MAQLEGDKNTNREIIQYDEHMKEIDEFPSQKIASLKTGISVDRIRYGRINNKSVNGYYFFFKNSPHPKFEKELICNFCGKTFICYHKHRLNAKHHFCCKECEGNFKKNESELNCTCCICNKKFHRKQSHIEKNINNVCSKECEKKLRKIIMSGENNHQYGLKGELNSSWLSNERISHYGYKLIRSINHPFKNIDDFVFEHRLIAEQYLLNDENSVEINGKKYLSPKFHVHHINLDKLDNKKENLYVMKKEIHISFHAYLRRINYGLSNEEIRNKYSQDELKQILIDFINKKANI